MPIPRRNLRVGVAVLRVVFGGDDLARLAAS
jgi:hypothetical protein